MQVKSTIARGTRYGRLIVLAEAPQIGKQRFFTCQCDCGTLRTVRRDHLLNGDTTSCGCYRAEVLNVSRTTHGLAESSEYRVWRGMRTRCENARNPAFPDYGGRGITICPEWQASFAAFYADMGPRPSLAHTIDRIDNDGPYAPGNCRWATKTEQQRNKRTTRRWPYQGHNRTIAEWLPYSVVPQRVLIARLYALRWDIGRALNEPLH